MNTFEEIQTALDALVAKMIDKGVERPSAGFTMNANSEKKYIYLCSSGRSLGGGGSTFFHADTPAECFAAANAFIDNLPSPEGIVTKDYLTRVASAVDYAGGDV